MEILEVNKKKLEKAAKVAIKVIKKGKVLVCPTDTVYGLVADATNKKAVKKIFKIKKRPKNKPIPIFVKDLKMAKRFAEIDKEKEKILKRIWPGKTTIILKRRKPPYQSKHGTGRVYGVDKKTIGLRIPNYKLLNILLSKLKKPLAETSVNISGKPALTEINEIIRHLKDKKNIPDLILDAGKLKKSLPSTVIDLTKKTPKILRRGEKALP